MKLTHVSVGLLGLLLISILVSNISPVFAKNPHNEPITLFHASTGQASGASLSSTGPSVVGVITKYGGLDETSSGSGGFVYAPPDTQVAVGSTYVVEMTNLAARVFAKSDNSIRTTYALSSSVIYNTASDSLTDPKVLYDSSSQKFFATIQDITTESVLIAVTGDPSASWTVYKTLMNGSPNCIDQPILGVSSNVVVASVNAFNCSTGNFLGSEYWVINKSDLVSGVSGPHVAPVFGPDITIVSAHPVQSLTTASVEYMVASAIVNGAFDLSHLTMITISGTPPSTVTTTRASVSIQTIGLTPGGYVPDAPQPGTALLINTDDFRVLDAVFYNSNIWLTFEEACTPTGDSTVRTCFRLTQINTSTSTTVQDFTVGTAGQYYFYPGLRVDGSGNLAVVFSFSSSSAVPGGSNIYPSVAVTGQGANDPSGTLAPVVSVVSGTTSDTESFACSSNGSKGGLNDCRYGDYSGAGSDPSDSGLVWVAGEYYPSSVWSTYVANVRVESFSISANPTSLSTLGRGSQSSTITVTSINQFSGTVPLSSSASPSGVSLGLNPGSVSLSAGGQTTSTLTVTATGTTTPGTYTATVTGTSGTVTRSTTVSFSALVPPPIEWQSANSVAISNAVSGGLPMTLVQGDYVLVGISIQGGFFGSVSSVTDNLGNSYVHDGTNTPGGFSVDLWCSVPRVGGSASIAVSLSIPATQFVISASQYSGVANGCGSSSFNAGNSGNVIDVNQFSQSFGNAPGIHWWAGFGGAMGTASMSQQNGVLRTSAVTNHGSGDVSGGIVDVSGTPGVSLALTMSLSASETSYAGMTELIPNAPLAVAFQSANSAHYDGATSGTLAMTLVPGEYVLVGISIQNGFFGSVSSVADNLGNNYVHDGTDTPGNFAVDLWCTSPRVGGSATITVSLSIPATQFVISASQYSGVQQGCGSSAFNAGNGGTIIDINQYSLAFQNSPGIHWWVGFGGAVGAATMSSNSGTLRTTAVTNNGSGDVSGGIEDITGNPGAVVDPKISLSASETSYAGMAELIQWAP